MAQAFPLPGLRELPGPSGKTAPYLVGRHAPGRAPTSHPLRLISSAFLVLLAFAVRVWGLAGHSLWLDEAQLLVRAQSDLPTALVGRTPLDLAPPLYPLLLHVWTRLGEPDFLVRFPSVVASVLAVAVLTRLRPRAVGLIAALLYAVAPTQIIYAQEATPYALVGLLASAALVAALGRGVIVKGNLSPAAWVVVLAVVSAYTYYGLAFLWLGLDLWLLARLTRARFASRRCPSPIRPTPYAVRPPHAPRPTIRPVLLGRLAVALACLPLLPLWQRQAQAGLDAWWGQYGSLEGWTGLLLFGQGALTQGLVFALLPFSQPSPWLVLALLGLVGLGARRMRWVAGSGLMALGVAYVAASLGRYPFEGRYLLFSAPALYALLAAGVTRLEAILLPPISQGRSLPPPLGEGRGEGPGSCVKASDPYPSPPPGGEGMCRSIWKEIRARGLGLAAIAALVAVLVSAWPGLGLPVPWAAHPPREDLRPLLAHLQQGRAPDDAVYVVYGAAPAVAHYQRLGLAPADLVLESGWPAGRTAFQASRALAAARGHPRLWLVVAHALPGEEEALARALTRRGAWLRQRVAAPGAALLLWDMGD